MVHTFAMEALSLDCEPSLRTYSESAHPDKTPSDRASPKKEHPEAVQLENVPQLEKVHSD